MIVIVLMCDCYCRQVLMSLSSGLIVIIIAIRCNYHCHQVRLSLSFSSGVVVIAIRCGCHCHQVWLSLPSGVIVIALRCDFCCNQLPLFILLAFHNYQAGFTSFIGIRVLVHELLNEILTKNINKSKYSYNIESVYAYSQDKVQVRLDKSIAQSTPSYQNISLSLGLELKEQCTCGPNTHSI